MSIHICTVEDFMVDAVETSGWCAVCCKEGAPLRLGWTDIHCGNCGNYWQTESLQRTVMLRRKCLGMSRKDMADWFGVKLSTIRHYENSWPSKRYWEATRAKLENTNANTNP